MNIKTSIVLLCMLISLPSVFAQKKKHVEKFKKEDIKNTTLLVPLNKNTPEYSLYLKQCIEKYWTFNEYKFINEEDLIPYLSDPKYSILIYSTFGGLINTQTLVKSQINVRYSIALGKSNITVMVNQSLSDEFERQIVVSCILPTKKKEYKRDEFPYPSDNKAFLSMIINNLQDSLNNIDANQTPSKKIKKKEDRNLEKEKDQIKAKERDSIIAAHNILVHEDYQLDYNKSTLAKMFKINTDKIFIVSAEDIITAIESQDKNVLIFTPIKTNADFNYTIYKAKDLKSLIQPNIYIPFIVKAMMYSTFAVLVATLMFFAAR